MGKFNLDQYETVKQRKQRFYADHEDGRIIVERISPDTLDYAEFKAYIFFCKQDQLDFAPRATGHALEVRDKELSVSSSGKEYESVNYSSWTENCEESAVGRALDNAGYASNGKPSRNEMIKAEKMGNTMKKYNEGISKADVDLVQTVLESQPDNTFAQDIAKKLKQYGALTEGQRKAMQKILDEEWEGKKDPSHPSEV